MVKVFNLQSEGVEIIDAEQVALVEMGGFSGQKKFVRKDSALAQDVCYRKLSDVEKRVYETLYENKDQALEFEAHILPLEVLKEILLVKNIPNLSVAEILIWHRTGMPGEGVLIVKVAWNDVRILARWGDPWREFEELHRLAVEEQAASFKHLANKKIGELTKIYEDPVTAAEAYMQGESISI